MTTQLENKLKLVDWGVLKYAQALSRQQELVSELQNGCGQDTLVLVEHPPVVTLGKRGNQFDLRVAESFFQAQEVDLHSIDRGGQATAHEPGLLVVYPIVELQKKDLHWYVQTFLGSVAAVLKEYGLKAEFKPGEPGLWVNGSKIVSFGVAVKKWVVSHGIALNVNNDLATFDLIIPCGKPAEKVTSMAQELGRPIDMAELKSRIAEKFCSEFSYQLDTGQGRPSWLKITAPPVSVINRMEELLRKHQLGTVCESAQCPNLGECFARGTATFMILGDKCTRQCRFCAVECQPPEPLDELEPQRVARAAKLLKLAYVVVTSVTRDDLSDGGSNQFARTIQQLRQELPATQVEVLVPDFQGSREALQTVFAARPDMFNHNIETVPRLYNFVRPEAQYERSLLVLHLAADFGLQVKSGLMLGLGETDDEILQTLQDLRQAGCDYLTIGQYLAPSAEHAPVKRYVTPTEFDCWALQAREFGFKEVAAGPLVRSSYQADQLVSAVVQNDTLHKELENG